jgi:hypothetical protein
MAEYVAFNKLEGVIAHRIRRAVCEPKPWSVAVFEREREHLTRFVRENICPLIENDVKRVLVRAPVKSGKREMVEYLAMRDKNTTKRRVHAFISSWHRTADSEQRDELETQNLSVFSIINDAQVESFLQWLGVNVQQDNDLVIHLDECDHGSGEKQKLSKIWSRIRNHVQITTILYSATPEEVMFSEELDTIVDDFMESHPPILYTPPEGYCGPARFLEEGLVYDALPFFTKDGLSDQAKELVGDMRESMLTEPSRNILILRLTYSLGGNKKDNKAIHVFLKNLSQYKELSDFFVIVDKPDKVIKSSHPILKQDIEWSSKNYWDFTTKDRPILIVHDQTATRSTEWSCHDRVFATHDYREAVTFVTVSQAQERVNHYEQKYGGFQRIRAYGHKKSFQLSAGQIHYKEYIGNSWTKHKVYKTDAYIIRKHDSKMIHPVYKGQYSEEDANGILQSLHSYVEVSLSNRLEGTIEDEYVVGCVFIPCNQDDDINELVQKELLKLKVESRNQFENQFVKSENKGKIDGQYQGYLREWKVFTYQQVVKEKRWALTVVNRVTICYNDGVLGVALRYRTGKIEEKSTLKPRNSMYN